MKQKSKGRGLTRAIALGLAAAMLSGGAGAVYGYQQGNGIAAMENSEKSSDAGSTAQKNVTAVGAASGVLTERIVSEATSGFSTDELLKHVETGALEKAVEKAKDASEPQPTAKETGEAIHELLALTSISSELNEDKKKELKEQAEQLKDSFDTLSEEEKSTLKESGEALDNAIVSLDVGLKAATDIDAIDNSKENSARYINGQPIAQAMELVEEETKDAERVEVAGAIQQGKTEDGKAGSDQGAEEDAVSAAMQIPAEANLAMVQTDEGQKLVRIPQGSTAAQVQNTLQNNGIATAVARKATFGVDVSRHNGAVNWDSLKSQGVKFAIIRSSQGSPSRKLSVDKQWERNIRECERVGLPWGAYIYSKSLSVKEAEAEAEYTLKRLAGRNPQLPIFYDVEDVSQMPLGGNTIAAMSKAFAEKIQAAGYLTGIYTMASWFNQYPQLYTVLQNNPDYYLWVARYPKNVTSPYNDWIESIGKKAGRLDMWQYSASTIFNGGPFDSNYWYGDFPPKETIKPVKPKLSEPVKVDGKSYKLGGQNGTTVLDKNGARVAEDFLIKVTDKRSKYYDKNNYYHVKDGYIQTGLSDLLYSSALNQWLYIKNGKTDFTYNNLYLYKGNWFYIKNGVIDWGYNAVVKSPADGKWYGVAAGMIRWDYTGIIMRPDNKQWYFVRNGVVDLSYTGVSVSVADNWFYYVKKGVLDWGYTGTAADLNGKVYYVQKGAAAKGYHGIVDGASGKKYYVKDGVQDSTATGLGMSKKDYKWYFVRNGVYDPTYTGAAVSLADGQLYYSENGILNWNYTGLATDQSKKQFFFMRKGAQDRSFTGLAKNPENRNEYYFKNGSVELKRKEIVKIGTEEVLIYNGIKNTSLTGIANYPGKNAYYFVQNGKVSNYTGVVTKIDSPGWFYVKSGKQIKDYTGFGRSIADGKQYYIKNGQLDFGFTGIVKNESGKRVLVKAGALDTEFTGVAYDDERKGWYFVQKGVEGEYTGVVISIADRDWYYVKDGKLDWNYTGFGRSIADGKQYYVKNGHLNFGTTDLVKDASGTRVYVLRGAKNTEFTGVVYDNERKGWYFVRNGVEGFYTGLVQSNSDTAWFYVRNGVLDWNYTGLSQSIVNPALFYVRGGVLRWDFNGYVNHNGKTYRVKGGVAV